VVRARRCQNAARDTLPRVLGRDGGSIVKVEKLSTVDAFVVFDLDTAETAAGVVRLAPKVLVEGATWLARSATYQFAVFGCRAGGASAGINAKADGRTEALAAFVGEVGPWVSERRVLLDPAKGASVTDLDALRAVDPRGVDHWANAPALAAAGVRAAAEAACGGSLDGRTVAVEGFERDAGALAVALGQSGARVVAVSTSTGTASDAAGFEPDRLVTLFAEHGADFVAELADEVAPTPAVIGAEADVLFVGSKAGVIGHDEAASVAARVVVPSGPVPLTAKALAALGRREVVVLPDFVTTAGAALSAFPCLGETGSAPTADGPDQIARLIAELLDGSEPPFLGACRRAEAFLSTWCDALPFGRPLA
jgi:glutamate dehydrogenase (NAD(P)+)